MEKYYTIVLVNFFVIFALALFPIYFGSKNKRGTSRINETTFIYVYPSALSWIMYSGLVIFPVLFFIGYIQNPEKNDPSSIKSMIGGLLFFLLCYFGGNYFRLTKIVLSEDEIIKKNIVGTKRFKLSEVKKIIIYRSEGNLAAAMTKLYCNGKKMSLESFLIDYDELILNLEKKCKYAKIIVK